MRAFTLVEIIIVVAIIALLASVGIPGLLRSRMSSNEATAQATLKTISNSCNMFALAHAGSYPESEDQLREDVPPYQNQAYCDASLHGYDYTCDFESTEYTATASPSSCGRTGSKDYTITASGFITSVPCGG